MKRFPLLIPALLCATFAAAQATRTTTTLSADGDKIEIADSTGTHLVTLSPGSDRGQVVLGVGSFAITLEGRRQSESRQPRIVVTDSDEETFIRIDTRRRKKIYLGTFGHPEFGFNFFARQSYSRYDPELNGFMDLKPGKSIHFGFTLLDFRINNFSTGLHFMFNDYAFSENITVRRENGTIVPVTLDRDYKKSKMNTAAIGIPVKYKIDLGKGFSLTPGLYGDLTLGAHTKYKRPKHKERLSGVNPWQSGASLYFAYRHIGIYARYGFSQTFRDGQGPRLHPVSLGFVLN